MVKKKKRRGIGERSRRSAEPDSWPRGNSIWFVRRVGGLGGRGGDKRGCSAVFDYRVACCCHKRMPATAEVCLKGVLLSLTANVQYYVVG